MCYPCFGSQAKGVAYLFLYDKNPPRTCDVEVVYRICLGNSRSLYPKLDWTYIKRLQVTNITIKATIKSRAILKDYRDAPSYESFECGYLDVS